MSAAVRTPAVRTPRASYCGHSMEPSDSMEATLPDLVEAIAQRVVELLREAPVGVVDAGAGEPVLWTTARVAAELGFSAEWVRDHRAELGVVTMPGARPRLLFEAAAVRAWATAREAGERSQAAEAPPARAPRRARRRSSGTGADLLPIRSESRAA